MKHIFNEIEMEYSELDKLNIKDLGEETIKLTVDKNNIKFEFLIRVKDNSDKAIVFGSGAYDYKNIELPVFQRFSWMDEFKENLIFYNDPTLYLGNIGLAWGYGNRDEFYLEIIGEILGIILKKIYVENYNTAIYGSSGGGFMALILASIIKGSKAIVNNPQTIIGNYYEKVYENLFNIIFPEIEVREALEKFPERMNVVNYYKKIQYIPEILYLQNMACAYDVNKQLVPFISQLQSVDEESFQKKVVVKMYCNKEENHKPLSKIDTINIITKTMEEKKYSVLEIRSNEWAQFSRREGYSIFRYNHKVRNNNMGNDYTVKINNIKFKNSSIKNIDREGYSDIYANGYIYLSISHSEICSSERISLENIENYFKSKTITICY